MLQEDKMIVQAYLPRELHGRLKKSIPWGSRNVLYQKVFEKIADRCEQDDLVAGQIIRGEFRIELE